MPNPSPEWRSRVIGLDEAVHPNVSTMAKAAEWFSKACLRDNRSKGSWMVLCGDTGVGKTHVAKKVGAYVRAHQIDAYASGWIRSDNLFSPVFARWDTIADASDREFNELLDYEVRGAWLVILDDIGAETDRFKSGVPEARLKAILDASENKWLLMTTNVHPDSWEERWGRRVQDRLREAIIITLDGVESYRGRK